MLVGSMILAGLAEKSESPVQHWRIVRNNIHLCYVLFISYLMVNTRIFLKNKGRDVTILSNSL